VVLVEVLADSNQELGRKPDESVLGVFHGQRRACFLREETESKRAAAVCMNELLRGWLAFAPLLPMADPITACWRYRVPPSGPAWSKQRTAR
jgi:hypothetical protein